MAAVTICSDFGAPKIKSDTVSTVSPPASWETYMQVKKQQLELDTEQQTGSK